MASQISVIISISSGAENIASLVHHLNLALSQNSQNYEIILIEDHSTDQTLFEINRLKPLFLNKLHLITGRPDKTQSLRAGLALAKYELVAIVDDNRQYFPEVLPAMIKLITSDQADMVVANRMPSQSAVLLRAFNLFFVRFLHGLN